MKLQVLISTMNQTNHSLLEKMNIQSDAIVVNQCDRNEFEEFNCKGNSILFLSLAERGVGLSRNTALMRATADICLFADDDVLYVDGYEKQILDAFINYSSADILMFNVPSTNPKRPLHTSKKIKRVRWFNCLKYGAVRIAVKTDKLRKVNVNFSLLFGGGAKYSAGEDSLFIAECLKKGLKIFTCPQTIGYASQEESTWFEGYTDKYFMDKGAFYACLSKRWAWIFCLQFAIRHRELFKNKRTVTDAIKLMLEGVKKFNNI